MEGVLRGSHHDHRNDQSRHLPRLMATAVRRERRTITPGTGVLSKPDRAALIVTAICEPQQIHHLPVIRFGNLFWRIALSLGST
jgi:hypothetical protein